MSVAGDALNSALGAVPGAGPALQAGVKAGVPGKVNDDLVKDRHTMLSNVLKGGGFHGQGLRIAMGIAWAESGADPNAEGHNSNGTQDTGLMQVNDVHAGEAGSPKALPAFHTWLKNADNNAVISYAISSGGTNFGPWTTYKSGAYRKYVGKDKQLTLSGDKGTVGGVAADAADAATSGLDSIAHLLSALGNPSTYLRLGKGALGGVFIALGTGAVVFVIANKASSGNVGKAAGLAVKAIK